MIKAEVVFDDCNDIIIGKYRVEVGLNVYCDGPDFNVYIDGCYIDGFSYLEQAIKYCLEN